MHINAHQCTALDRVIRALAFALLYAALLMSGCARPQQPAPPAPPLPTPEVTADRALLAYFAVMHARFSGAETAPREYVLCLYGRKELARIVIEQFGAPPIGESSATSVRYGRCPQARDYLGTWHLHIPADYGERTADGCWQSDADVRDFLADAAASIDLISCGDGRLFWAVKPRWR